MTRMHYHLVRRSAASPDTLFAILHDAPGWRHWAPLVTSSRWAHPAVTGVGAVREIGSNGVGMRERITVHEPPYRHGYVMVGDRPARDYRALVSITPEGEGTRIEWEGSFEPNPAGIGHAYAAFVRSYLGRLLDALVAEAERTDGVAADVTPERPLPRLAPRVAAEVGLAVLMSRIAARVPSTSRWSGPVRLLARTQTWSAWLSPLTHTVLLKLTDRADHTDRADQVRTDGPGRSGQ